jgi:hypothetical protein
MSSKPSDKMRLSVPNKAAWSRSRTRAVFVPLASISGSH